MPPNNNYFNGQPAIPPAAVSPLQPPAKRKWHWIFIIVIILLSMLLIAALVFGYWTYNSRQNYKNNSDKISAAAVKKANEEQKKVLEAQFEEREKSPYKKYISPAQYGALEIVYSKMWSAYVIEQSNSSGTVVNGYFYPDFVPNVGDNDKINYSLRIQIIDSNYNTELNKYAQQVKKGTLKSTPFVPELVKGATVGVRLDGQLEQNKRGAMVILPLRDKVVKIWSENQAALNDFNNIILKNLSYTP
jgi:hypothetical protein